MEEKEINTQDKFKNGKVKKSGSWKAGLPVAQTNITLPREADTLKAGPDNKSAQDHLRESDVKISVGAEEVWGRERMQKGHGSVKPQRKPTGGGCQTYGMLRWYS